MVAKHKQIFGEIKGTIESFIDEFNGYFYDHVFKKFVDQIQKLAEEKLNKYIEVSKHYHNQIKEMEFLLNSDNDDLTHTDSIKQILDQLKDEQQHELDMIDLNYNKLINENQLEFKNDAFKNDPGIQLIEEKFKLEMFNMINSIFSKA